MFEDKVDLYLGYIMIKNFKYLKNITKNLKKEGMVLSKTIDNKVRAKNVVWDFTDPITNIRYKPGIGKYVRDHRIGHDPIYAKLTKKELRDKYRYDDPNKPLITGDLIFNVKNGKFTLPNLVHEAGHVKMQTSKIHEKANDYVRNYKNKDIPKYELFNEYLASKRGIKYLRDNNVPENIVKEAKEDLIGNQYAYYNKHRNNYKYGENKFDEKYLYLHKLINKKLYNMSRLFNHRLLKKVKLVSIGAKFNQ